MPTRPEPPKSRRSEDERVHLIVAGSRVFDLEYYDEVKEHLNFFTQDMDDPIIIHGGAKGIDRLAAKWAEWNWYLQQVYYPDYETYDGKVAPIMRNKEMAKAGDYLLAFHDGESKGTQNMIAEAKAVGLHTEIIKLKVRECQKNSSNDTDRKPLRTSSGKSMSPKR